VCVKCVFLPGVVGIHAKILFSSYPVLSYFPSSLSLFFIALFALVVFDWQHMDSFQRFQDPLPTSLLAISRMDDFDLIFQAHPLHLSLRSIATSSALAGLIQHL